MTLASVIKRKGLSFLTLGLFQGKWLLLYGLYLVFIYKVTNPVNNNPFDFIGLPWWLLSRQSGTIQKDLHQNQIV